MYVMFIWLLDVIHASPPIKGKVHIYLETKLHNYQLKQAIGIPINARP